MPPLITNSGIRLAKPLLWASAILVALISILLALNSLPLGSHDSTTRIDSAITKRLSNNSIVNELVTLVKQVVSRGHPHHHHHHHHRRHRVECDDSIWSSPIAAKQNVSLVLTVDLKGCANFSSVQKAIDAVPAYSPNRTLIILDSGLYREKVTVWANKTNVTLQGQGYLNTSIVWNGTANSSNGTSYSASVSIFAFNFIAYNISFKNSAPPPSPGRVGAQAVALRITGDQAAFYGCGFYGAQDTLLDDQGRHYFLECFIEGSIDFIFGNGRSLYEKCTINSIAEQKQGRGVTGCITAHARNKEEENTGFSFVNCSIGGTGMVWLGRAWQPYSTVIFSRSYMSEIISPDGWNNWNNSSNDRTVFYGEYECMGPGANTTGRVPYAKQLDDSAAAPYMDISYINGNEWVLPLPPSEWHINPYDGRRHKGLIKALQSDDEQHGTIEQ